MSASSMLRTRSGSEIERGLVNYQAPVSQVSSADHRFKNPINPASESRDFAFARDNKALTPQNYPVPEGVTWRLLLPVGDGWVVPPASETKTEEGLHWIPGPRHTVLAAKRFVIDDLASQKWR